MASNNSLAFIEKLTGRENYSTWQFAVKTYLQHEELWDCIEVNPGSSVDLKRDIKAKTKIILLVDPINYVHIQEESTAKGVWDKLAAAFDDSGLTRRVGLLRDLCNTSLSGCTSIEEYVSKIMSTAHKLRNIGFKVDDEWLGTLLLSGLPESYQPMIIAIESSGTKITADSVKAKLLQDVRNTDNNTTAFAVNKKFHNNTANKKFSKGPRCYSCNQYGHKSTECNKQKPKNKTNKPSSSYAAVFVASSHYDDSWYIDSGASAHMTKTKNIFVKETTPITKNIRVADNKVLLVQSSGDVSLNIYDQKGQENKILFTNVLYVPELATNLISVSQIIKNGGQVKFDTSGCVIINSKNQIIATASIVNNMYRLNMPGGLAHMSSVEHEQDAFCWHQRMGHLNFQSLKKMSDNTEHVTFSGKTENLTCITCKEGKQTRLPFKSDGSKVTKPLELVHSDVCGPMEIQSLGGSRYFLTFLDEYSKKISVYFLHNKSEVLSKFKEFKQEVENQLDAHIKVLRTDNGLEYDNKAFTDYLKGAGIIHQTTTPYTPEQNGTAERMNRTLVEKAKCMLLNAGLPKLYWADAIHTAAYIINRSPTRSLAFKTPMEMWSGRKPNVDHMRIFGCEAMVHLPKEKRRKWDPKAHKMIFLGYCDHTKGYRFILPNSRKVIRSRDATFLESSVKRDFVQVELLETDTEKGKINSRKEDEIDETKEDSLIDNDTNSESSYETVKENRSASDSEYLPDTSIDSPSVSNVTLRPRNKTKSKNSYLPCTEEYTHLCLFSSCVPVTYEEAVHSINKNEWIKSINEELEAHKKNETWTLVEKPPNAKVIGSKWVFRIKEEPTGPRFKSRLCAKGFAQTAGIDFTETFAPTVRYDSIRLLLSMAVQNRLKIIQLDVKTAFLYGELEETIFMSPPEGLPCENKMVCKLNRSLYGLKQAPRCWNKKFDSILKKFGFINSKADQCVYVGNVNKDKCYLCLYVDDGLLFSKSESTLKEITKELQSVLEVKILNTPTNFVGMQIEILSNGIFIHQTKYVEQMLEKFNMTDTNPNTVPVDPHVKLQKGDGEPEKDYPYREAVGSLMHLATVSRPEIMFAVSLVSRFLNCYNKSHWHAVMKIFKYLKDTKDYGLYYSSTSEPPAVTGYSDADYANDIDTRRSVTGYVFIKNGAAVTWSSQRQQTVALSTTEAEFMAACAATKEAMWIKQLLCDIGEYKQDTMCLHLDNQSAISVIKNINFHKRCKHIDIKYHFIKEKYFQKIIDLKSVSTADQYADILTKALSKDKFQFLRSKLGMFNYNSVSK